MLSLLPPSWLAADTAEPGHGFLGTWQQPFARDPAAGSLLGSVAMRGGAGPDVLRGDSRTPLVLSGAFHLVRIWQ